MEHHPTQPVSIETSPSGRENLQKKMFNLVGVDSLLVVFNTVADAEAGLG